MSYELYLQETRLLTEGKEEILEQVFQKLQSGELMSKLEQEGTLRVLQTLIENAIGKAKQMLKHNGKVVPVSAYDSFQSLGNYNLLASTDLETWYAIIGFRNKLVHEYMRVDFGVAEQLIVSQKYKLIVDFLNAD